MVQHEMKESQYEVLSVICDKICKHPYYIENDEELLAICEKCPVEELLKKAFAEERVSIEEKMKAQENNAEVNPEAYVKPSWELAKDIVENL